MYGPLGVFVGVGKGVLVGVLVGTGVSVGEGVGVGGTPTTMVVSLLSAASDCTASKTSLTLAPVNAGSSVTAPKPSQA